MESIHHEEAAQAHLVGAVMSSWNHFHLSGRTLIERGEGCRVWDAAGVERIDWLMGWGSLVLGHNPQAVFAALEHGMANGFGMPYETPRNGELAGLFSELVPCAEKIRLCNSGSEATLHALRIARAVTGRPDIVKFEGHFHGLNDYLLYGVDGSPRLGAVAGDGMIEPVAGSSGLPDASLSKLIHIAPYNNLPVLERLFQSRGNEIAAIIMEPAALNIGCVSPDAGYLDAVRALCTQYGALLIFDEVLTGFRLSEGGAQKRFGVLPDLACFGKAMGCGMPVAALAGKAEFMEVLSPVGTVEMAGTNTARHMTVHGVIAAIREMVKTEIWDDLTHKNAYFSTALADLCAKYGIPAHIEGWGGRIGIHFGAETRPRNFREVVAAWKVGGAFHRACYAEAHERKALFGFFLPLGPCPEPVTLSAAHTYADLDETLNRVDSIFSTVNWRPASA